VKIPSSPIPDQQDLEHSKKLMEHELRLALKIVRKKCCTREIATARTYGEAISTMQLGDCFEKPGT
jgi:hypothetical protein